MRLLLCSSLFSLLFVASCSPSRFLQKAKVYVKGSPPVQVMAVRPEALGVDLDPMRYSMTFMQLVEEALKAEGIETAYVGLEESIELEKSSHFILEVGMVMVQEHMAPVAEPPMQGAPGSMPASLQANVAAMLQAVDKKGEGVYHDFHIDQALTVEEQAKAVEENPTVDVYQVAMEKGVQELVLKTKEQVMEHLKANKSNL